MRFECDIIIADEDYTGPPGAEHSSRNENSERVSRGGAPDRVAQSRGKPRQAIARGRALVAGFLLDANVLIALAWPAHVSHSIAHKWFDKHAHRVWATCPLTECAFVRAISNPAFSLDALTPQSAIELLTANLKHPTINSGQTILVWRKRFDMETEGLPVTSRSRMLICLAWLSITRENWRPLIRGLDRWWERREAQSNDRLTATYFTLHNTCYRTLRDEPR